MVVIRLNAEILPYKNVMHRGRGGGQVFSVLAFYSDDPSSDTAVVYNCC